MTKKPTKDEIIKNLQDKVNELVAENLHYQKENERIVSEVKDMDSLLESKMKQIYQMHGEISCLKEAKAFVMGELGAYKKFLGTKDSEPCNCEDCTSESINETQLMEVNVNELPEPVRNMLSGLFNQQEKLHGKFFMV